MRVCDTEIYSQEMHYFLKWVIAVGVIGTFSLPEYFISLDCHTSPSMSTLNHGMVPIFRPAASPLSLMDHFSRDTAQLSVAGQMELTM